MNFLSSGFWKFLTFTHESHPCLGGGGIKIKKIIIQYLMHTLLFTLCQHLIFSKSSGTILLLI